MTMALWAKIQSLSTDCQRQILSLYNEEDPKYKFPIEVRTLFAEVLENAVCGTDGRGVEGGLDPYNPQHSEAIINFFTSLIGQLEERLANAQSGDQFFTRHTLSETLANIKEKKLSDPYGMYEHIRNRIKSEWTLVAQQEAADLNNMSHERDPILDNIQSIKAYIAGGTAILKKIRTNEENFALNFNKKQEIEAILNDPEKLRSYPGYYETQLKENLATLDCFSQQSIRNFQALMQQFEQTINNNLNYVAILQNQIISEKLSVWKHEQQQMANGINKNHSVSLDTLQIWCEELADLIWKNYEQLRDAEHALHKGIIPTEPTADLTFVQSRMEEAVRLLQDVLNHSLIVEEQPSQIIKLKTKFSKTVVVSLLVGKRLNIHMNSPELTTCIIGEEQARNLPVTDKLETIGEITNGKVMMDKSRDDFKRITFPFRSMQVKKITRADRRGSTGNDRVMEEKCCLYFECMATVGPIKFKVSTISLPVVVISHGSQEALAVAKISWDNAFAERGRELFKVPESGPWDDVAQILNAKFKEVAGRGLTNENLECLAKKAFRNREPRPQTITWFELCKDNLPGRNFTFWTWFHAALKLIEKKENNLKELWKEGLIMGFIERETAETLISRCDIGTFLLRFSDSITGAITIVLLVRPGTVVSLNPFQQLDLQSKKISMSIKELEKLKFLYTPHRSISKDEAFKKFYDKENSQTPGITSGYVPLLPIIPDGENSNGSATPVPLYDGSMFSHGGLPGLSPISMEQSSSSFFVHSPSPSTTFQDVQSPASTIVMDTNYYENNDNASSGFLFIQNTSTGPISPISQSGELETPLPVLDSEGQVFQFSNDYDATRFEDLIRVGEEVMEEQL